MQMRTTEDRGTPDQRRVPLPLYQSLPACKKELVADLKHDEWHQLTVEVRGPNVKCWVDDELGIDFADNIGSVFLNGTIGLYAYGGHGVNAVVSYDDVAVEPLQ